MTAQFDDTFRYRDRDYSIAGISEGELFDISLLGLKPSMASTACWRGYLAVFGLAESHLVLDTLHVNLLRPGDGRRRFERQEGPIINGVAPTPQKKSPPKEDLDELDFFNNHYDGLSYQLKYSGGILLADGFIQSLYVHMGFHPAWKYTTVIELVFDAGILKGEFDRSDRMAEVREMITKAPKTGSTSEMPTRKEIEQFVERAFDRSYRR
jgi:hypothetical protein